MIASPHQPEPAPHLEPVPVNLLTRSVSPAGPDKVRLTRVQRDSTRMRPGVSKRGSATTKTDETDRSNERPPVGRGRPASGLGVGPHDLPSLGGRELHPSAASRVHTGPWRFGRTGRDRHGVRTSSRRSFVCIRPDDWRTGSVGRGSSSAAYSAMPSAVSDSSSTFRQRWTSRGEACKAQARARSRSRLWP